MDLTNASAIVTGGAGGFGSATVRRLAQKGAKVVIADVSDERGEALAREVGSGSLYVSTDCRTKTPSPRRSRRPPPPWPRG
jgi:NAD(P)-dependent dehydrogenase (short-subunit alcohol dehydrogenase family)